VIEDPKEGDWKYEISPVGEINDPIDVFIDFEVLYSPVVPVFKLSGPLNGTEGTPLMFDASQSTPAQGYDMYYRWDFDNDSIWDIPWSKDTVAEHIWNDDYDGNIIVEATDKRFKFRKELPIVIYNSAPKGVITGSNNSYTGHDMEFHLTVSDPGSDDTHLISWDFGDGRVVNGSTSIQHNYSEQGIYDIKASITDDEGSKYISTYSVIITDFDELFSEDLKYFNVSMIENASYEIHMYNPFIDVITYGLVGRETVFDFNGYFSNYSNVKVRWDFDLDGEFDAETTDFVVEHIFDENYTGYVRIDVITDDRTEIFIAEVVIIESDLIGLSDDGTGNVDTSDKILEKSEEILITVVLVGIIILLLVIIFVLISKKRQEGDSLEE
jgi:hypothetical protein